MSRICRMVSTLLIAAGLGFLCFYTYTQSADNKFAVLTRPSYYILQNYWYIFLAGIAVLLFSLLGSFFSWFKAIEKKEVILPNAGYSSEKEIAGWVDGTSLDTVKIPEGSTGDKTEALLGEAEMETVRREARTEQLPEEDRTEILAENQMTIHDEEMQEERK